MLDVVVRTLIQFGTRVGIDHRGSITLSGICHRALNSAQFWEMPNIRREHDLGFLLYSQHLRMPFIAVLLSSIETKCKVLQSVDISSVLRSNGQVTPPDTSLDETIQALHFVLHMPTEYLDKTRRALIARAAIACDILLLKAGRSRVQDHIALRTLIFRIAQETGNIDLLVSTVQSRYRARGIHLSGLGHRRATWVSWSSCHLPLRTVPTHLWNCQVTSMK
jgi:hypothetical protein